MSAPPMHPPCNSRAPVLCSWRQQTRVIVWVMVACQAAYICAKGPGYLSIHEWRIGLIGVGAVRITHVRVAVPSPPPVPWVGHRGWRV